jgi:hypothetical protein
MWVYDWVSHAQVAVATIVTGLCSLSGTRSDDKLLYSSAADSQQSTYHHCTLLPAYIQQKDEGGRLETWMNKRVSIRTIERPMK